MRLRTENHNMKMHLIKTILTLGALSCAMTAAAALPENDSVFRAMNDEMSRSIGRLKMDSLQKPYFLVYQVTEGRSLEITASFGAVETEYATPYRRLRVDLRVGSPAFDNSNYAPNEWEGYRVEADWSLALTDNYDSLRYSIWAATDKAYKKALETHSKKTAYKESKNITELFDDMTPQPPYQLFQDAEGETLDAALWRENIRKVSAVFLKYPAVKYSNVRLNFQSGNARFLDSEGSAFKQPDCLGSVVIEAKAYAPDGFPLSAGNEQDFCLAKDAPALDTLIEKAEETGKKLSGWINPSGSKLISDPYSSKKTRRGNFLIISWSPTCQTRARSGPLRTIGRPKRSTGVPAPWLNAWTCAFSRLF